MFVQRNERLLHLRREKIQKRLTQRTQRAQRKAKVFLLEIKILSHTNCLFVSPFFSVFFVLSVLKLFSAAVQAYGDCSAVVQFLSARMFVAE
jgi:hypothetical protein